MGQVEANAVTLNVAVSACERTASVLILFWVGRLARIGGLNWWELGI